MPDLQRAQLFGKLHPLAYKALESAATLCKLRGNPFVELPHWVNQILQGPDSDLHRINRHFGVDQAPLSRDLVHALDQFPQGATTVCNLSPYLDEVAREAWTYSTLMFGESRIRTGHLVVALLKNRALTAAFHELSGEFRKIKFDPLTENFAKIVEGSPEETPLASDASGLAAGAAPGETSGATVPGAGKQEALNRFSVDLTEKARKGEIDPIVGRDEEIRQVIDILMRRRQNNPVLVGDAGVGKTAIVEGFATRIVCGDVPPSLRNVTLRALDVGLLQAGASMKGEFEQRLRSVIDEVQQSSKPVILFIDEVHTLIGAGGAAGTGDAANLLKPALARGTLRTLAATTWDEYRKHIEKDPALSRRFQQIFITEPDEAKAIQMLRSATSHLEKHHQVQILDDAIEAAVRLSSRFIPARQLPDKAVSLLDTAAARVAISQHAVPARVEDARRRIQLLELELERLHRETSVGLDHQARLAELKDKLANERAQLAKLEKRWEEEKALVAQILDLRSQLRAAGSTIEAEPDKTPPVPPALKQKSRVKKIKAASAPPIFDRDKPLAELKALQQELMEFQGESPLLFPSVDQGTVASVVADWTGIPVGRMARQNAQEMLDLADLLERRVLGQRHALETVARRIQTSRAKLENPDRPIGVFMFVGPSGTGKTETALTLAETLYGGEQNLISINMSEFQEKHTVSTLKGAPPGYVGYGEGGVLTEAVRRRPYSVVLLDEFEKAHPDVHKIFFQVFDKGYMEDSEGRSINFRNAVIILTSNAAQETITKMCADPALLPAPEALEEGLRGPLLKTFPDALLNRLVVVPFYPISKEVLHRIIRLQLTRVEARVRENHKAPFTYEPAVLDLVAERCANLERGARVVETLINNTVLPEIGREFLRRLTQGQELGRVHVEARDGQFIFSFD